MTYTVASLFKKEKKTKTLKTYINSLMVSQQPSAAWCVPGSHDGPLGHYCLTALDSLVRKHRQKTDCKRTFARRCVFEYVHV